jgi:transposase
VREITTSYVGLDIHKDSIALAIADTGRTPPRFIGTINPLPSELCKALRRQRCSPSNTLLVYEAGPCGYGWARYLRKQGWQCEVIAPSRITRSPAEQRIKTDRRDALMLARQLRAGDLTAIVVPDERDEAIRDLSRAREDACAALRFEHPAQEIAFNEYRAASKDACERVERITAALREQCEGWRMNPVVKALMCLKGFEFVAARKLHQNKICVVL